MKGLIHLYCGDGKGKTTAAVGVAIRAAGSGMNVVFTQFLKGSISGEINILCNMENVTVFRNERDLGFLNSMSESEVKQVTLMHNSNLKKSYEIMSKGKCDMLILDEICAAYELRVVDRTLVNSLIYNKPDSLELVFTGRNPDKIFVKNADYITKMCKLRHPFDKRIQARKGIEY